MKKDKLEREALKELMLEATEGAVRARVCGALGWHRDTAPAIDQLQLQKTLSNLLNKRPESDHVGRLSQKGGGGHTDKIRHRGNRQRLLKPARNSSGQTRSCSGRGLTSVVVGRLGGPTGPRLRKISFHGKHDEISGDSAASNCSISRRKKRKKRRKRRRASSSSSTSRSGSSECEYSSDRYSCNSSSSRSSSQSATRGRSSRSAHRGRKRKRRRKESRKSRRERDSSGSCSSYSDSVKHRSTGYSRDRSTSSNRSRHQVRPALSGNYGSDRSVVEVTVVSSDPSVADSDVECVAIGGREFRCHMDRETARSKLKQSRASQRLQLAEEGRKQLLERPQSIPGSLDQQGECCESKSHESHVGSRSLIQPESDGNARANNKVYDPKLQHSDIDSRAANNLVGYSSDGSFLEGGIQRDSKHRLNRRLISSNYSTRESKKREEFTSEIIPTSRTFEHKGSISKCKKNGNNRGRSPDDVNSSVNCNDREYNKSPVMSGYGSDKSKRRRNSSSYSDSSHNCDRRPGSYNDRYSRSKSTSRSRSSRSQSLASQRSSTSLRDISENLDVSLGKRSRSNSRNASLAKRSRRNSGKASLDKRSRSNSRNASLAKRSRSNSRNASLAKRSRRNGAKASLDKRSRRNSGKASLDKKSRRNSGNASLDKRSRRNGANASLDKRSRRNSDNASLDKRSRRNSGGSNSIERINNVRGSSCSDRSASCSGSGRSYVRRFSSSERSNDGSQYGGTGAYFEDGRECDDNGATNIVHTKHDSARHVSNKSDGRNRDYPVNVNNFYCAETRKSNTLNHHKSVHKKSETSTLVETLRSLPSSPRSPAHKQESSGSLEDDGPALTLILSQLFSYDHDHPLSQLAVWINSSVDETVMRLLVKQLYQQLLKHPQLLDRLKSSSLEELKLLVLAALPAGSGVEPNLSCALKHWLSGKNGAHRSRNGEKCVVSDEAINQESDEFSQCKGDKLPWESDSD